MSRASEAAKLFDTHCHLDFAAFDSCRDTLLENCAASGIRRVLVPSARRSAWSKVASLSCSGSLPVSVAFGLHPYFIRSHRLSDLSELEAWLDRERACVAVGEIGLDATRPEMDLQEDFFCRQLELARQRDLPVIVHSFKTHSRVYKLIKESGVRRGVVHAFSGSVQDASRFLELGLNLGVGPVITWEGSSKTRKTFSELPLTSLVLETDAPDMPVCGKARGAGSPLDLTKVYEALCQLRQEGPGQIAETLWKTSCRLFDPGC